jgi:hypothetical protein
MRVRICDYHIIEVVRFLNVSATFVAFLGEVFYEGYITKTTKPIYKYKILKFKYVTQNIC